MHFLISPLYFYWFIDWCSLWRLWRVVPWGLPCAWVTSFSGRVWRSRSRIPSIHKDSRSISTNCQTIMHSWSWSWGIWEVIYSSWCEDGPVRWRKDRQRRRHRGFCYQLHVGGILVLFNCLWNSSTIWGLHSVEFQSQPCKVVRYVITLKWSHWVKPWLLTMWLTLRLVWPNNLFCFWRAKAWYLHMYNGLFLFTLEVYCRML